MRIAIINTGGTISCTGTPLAPMTAPAFADATQRLVEPSIRAAFPSLELDFITDLRFDASAQGTLDSTNLQPRDWCVLAERILADYDEHDGWVILHGTDSLAYTASALPFLLSSFAGDGSPTARLDKPVILTGSQVPLFDQDAPGAPLSLRFNTDAFQNLCAAIAAATTGIPEVAVAFRGRLFRGARVVKTDASQDDAFDSPNFPPLATFGITTRVESELVLPAPEATIALSSPVVRSHMQERLAHISEHIADAAVVPLSAFPASVAPDGTAFLAHVVGGIVAAGARALVLSSYGAGNFPSGNADDPTAGAIAQALTAASEAGVLIVNASQVLAGTVDDSIYAAGSWMHAAGAIGIGDMTAVAAFSKTTVLLAAEGWTDQAGIPSPAARDLVPRDLLGEVSPRATSS